MGWEWIAVIISLASAAYSIAMSKKMRNQEQDRGGLAVNRFGIDQPLHVVYGQRRIPPVIVYQGVKDISGDPDNEEYYAILVWTPGPIDRIDDFTFDDLPYTDFGSFDGFSGQSIEHQFGHADQTMPAWFFNDAPDDMTGMDFRGLAVTYVKLRMDDEFKRYPQGRPEFRATITARSSNPVDVLFDYLFNADYGCGWAVDWDEEHNNLMRNHCMVPINGAPQMVCNIILETDQKLQDNIDNILQTCRGYLIEGQNGLRLEIDRAKDPVLHVSEDMLTGGMSTASVNINQRYNSVTIRFPNRDIKWQTDEVTFPPANSELHLQWLEEDNGVDLTREETVYGIDSYEHALQYAEVLARTSRESMTLNLPVKAFIGWQVEPMDVITVASTLRGWTAKQFSVREISYSESETKLKLVEYQDSNYLWTAKPPKPDYPDTELPNPSKVAPPSGLSFSESTLPAVSGVLSWESPGGYVAGFDVRVYAAGQVVWQQTTKTTSLGIPVFLSGNYEFAVRTIGAVAVSSWAVLSATFEAPETPFEVTVDAGNTYVILRPKSATLAFGTEYEFWFNDELRGTGVGWQLEGLQPETEYAFKVRAVNAVGQSDFITVTATTTKDASVIIDLIGGKITQEILDDNLQQFLDQVEKVGAANSSAIDEISGSLETVKGQVTKLDRTAQSLSETAFGLASDMQNIADEFQRRMLEGETLVDAVVYRNPETGIIVNRAFAYTEAKYTEAGLRIDGVNAAVAITTQEIERVETDTGQKLVKANAAIEANAAAITLKTSYQEVNEAISGALAAITPAYSWQFNTSDEGWPDVTWQLSGTIVGSVFARNDLAFNADENQVVRLRLKATENGTLSWNGGQQNVTIHHPGVADEFETVIIKLSAADGWAGDITAIRIAMDAEIDSIEIGKPSAAELQLQDVSYRMATVEQELDPKNARWGVYVTQDYWDTNALTLTDVNQAIDGWDAKWSVSATLKQFDENQTLEKANAARLWIDASESNITSVVTAYNAKPGGIDEQLADQASKLTTAQQQIDAANGKISQTVSSLVDVENTLGQKEGLDDLLTAYHDFLRTGDFAKDSIGLSYAEQSIKANSSDIASQASAILQLLAIKDEQQAAISRIDKTLATQTTALAQSSQKLEAKISEGDSATLAQANTFTKAAVGYCVDVDGNITDHDDAVLCVQDGHSWVDGPLANFIRNLAIKTADGQTASVSQMSQAFVDNEGQLVAKGGMLTNVNGQVSGMVATNTGETSSIDLLADYTRVGKLDKDGKFVPLFYLDSQTGDMVHRGRFVLGDGYSLSGVDDIYAKSGAGVYSLTLRDGVFPTDAVATQDFKDAYHRAPVKDEHLSYRNAAGTKSSMKRFDGQGWTATTLILNGDMLTTGTVKGDRIVANTEIEAPILRGGTGEFGGKVTAKDGSFLEKVEIGSAGGYRAYIQSVASAGYNMITVENPSGDVVFSVQGNGNLYSIGGGYLDNLTIGTNCNIQGTLRADQIIGDVVSAKAVIVDKTSYQNTYWTTIAAVSGVNNTGKVASLVIGAFALLSQLHLYPDVDSVASGSADFYCRILFNGAEVARSYVGTKDYASDRSKLIKNGFSSPTYCRNLWPGEGFTVHVQTCRSLSSSGRGSASASLSAQCDTVAQLFRTGSAFY